MNAHVLANSDGEHDCGSPSQQPSLKRQTTHCQVWCTQRISAPQRQHRSALLDQEATDRLYAQKRTRDGCYTRARAAA
jgi:hypothetical protein